MNTRKIGSLDVSVVGLGCNTFGWRIDESATRLVLDAAMNAGVNFFDTADIYGGTQSEEFMGRWLGPKRDQIVLATKFGMKVSDGKEGAKPEYIRRAVEDSLKRLQTDRIDLYQLHRPDDSTPISETLDALSQLVQAGKVREIGCSNFSAPQLIEAQETVKHGAAAFVSVQNEYSLLHREPEAQVLPECQRQNLAFLPYFPLASGLLTGKYRRGQSAPEGARLDSERFAAQLSAQNLELVENLLAFAKGRGHTLLELAFSWLLSKQSVASVIAGATSSEQIQHNAAAANWELSADELARIDAILAS